MDDCLAWMAEASAEVVMTDARSQGARIALRFLGELDAIQKKALQAIVPHDAGVLVAPPGIGNLTMSMLRKRQKTYKAMGYLDEEA